MTHIPVNTNTNFSGVTLAEPHIVFTLLPSDQDFWGSQIQINYYKHTIF